MAMHTIRSSVSYSPTCTWSAVLLQADGQTQVYNWSYTVQENMPTSVQENNLSPDHSLISTS